MTTRAWRTELRVPVVDAVTGTAMMVGPLGKKIPLHRSIPNAPLRYFFKDEPIIILDWSKMDKVVTQKVKEHREAQTTKGEGKTKSQSLNKYYWLEALQEPIKYEGQKYHGWYSWGSAVKDMQTLGLVEDILLRDGLAVSDVHFLYSAAALIPDATFGAGIFENAKILLLPPGSVFAGQVIADGAGVIGRKHFETFYDWNRTLVKLNRMARNNYQVAQRFDWNEVVDEVTQMCHDRQDMMDRFGYDLTLRWVDSASGDYKRALVDVEPDMLFHAYIRHQVDDSQAEFCAQLGSSIPFEGVTRIAIPTLEKNWVYDPGRYLGVRWPVDSPSNVAPVDIKTRSADLARVKEAQVVQYRYVQPSAKWNRRIFAKGCAVVVDQELMQGYDLVLCSMDIKMINTDLAKIRRICGQQGQYELNVPGDSIFSITMAYEPGVAVGCPIEIWKNMGGDFDGDYITMYDCGKYPKIFEHVQSWTRNQKSLKIKKVFRSSDWRPEMIWNSFKMRTGQAVNVVSSTFVDAMSEVGKMFTLLDTTITKAITFLGPDYAWAHQLSPIDRLEFWRTTVVKIMTDGYKSSAIKLRVWSANLGAAQSHISDSKAYDGLAPWCVWKKGVMVSGVASKWAFRRGLPEFRDQLPESKQIYYASPLGKEAKKGSEWLSHIPPRMSAATIVRIYQVWKPWFEKHWDKVENGLKIVDQVDTYPLSHFTKYVPPVHRDDLEKAFELKAEYDAVVGEIDWTDGTESRAFKDTWQEVCERWVEQFSNREYGVYCLWRAAHHARGEQARAACVFMGFPDECMEIVTRKPGNKANQVKTVLLGLSRNIVGKPRKKYDAQFVRVESGDLFGEKKTYVVSEGMNFPGIMKVRPQHVPEDLIGTIATIEPSRAKKGFGVPPDGRYIMTLARMENSQTAYFAFLTRCELDAETPHQP